MPGKEEKQGGHEGVQWKRLVNIICFIDLTVKACRLSFMLLWLAPLKILQLQIKNDFLQKNLAFLFIFLFLSFAYQLKFCMHYCLGFTHFIIFMGNHYDGSMYNCALPISSKHRVQLKLMEMVLSMELLGHKPKYGTNWNLDQMVQDEWDPLFYQSSSEDHDFLCEILMHSPF